LLSTVDRLELVAEGESAALALAAEVPVVTVPRLPEESAEVDDEAAEMPLVEDAESSALPELEAAPEPAPADEPWVLEAVEELVGLVCED
jgi:hypothetical protein